MMRYVPCPNFWAVWISAVAVAVAVDCRFFLVRMIGVIEQ